MVDYIFNIYIYIYICIYRYEYCRISIYSIYIYLLSGIYIILMYVILYLTFVSMCGFIQGYTCFTDNFVCWCFNPVQATWSLSIDPSNAMHIICKMENDHKPCAITKMHVFLVDLLVGGLEHCFIFHILGISSSQLTHIFQRGWNLNHQI